MHRRSVLGAFLGQFAGGETCSTQPVTPGSGTDVIDRVTHSGGGSLLNILMPENAGAKRIDQGIAFVAGIEIYVSAHIGNPQTIPIVGNPADHSTEQTLDEGGIQVSEAQGIGQQHGTGPHRENVAHDPAHSGGRPLEGLDGARVIVRLDLKGDPPALTDVNDPGVFLTRLDENLTDRILVLLFGWKKSE